MAQYKVKLSLTELYETVIDEDDELCLGCSKPMWVEGYIEDDIQLCHLCYENQYTEKGQG
jgi:hypothetical protein